VKHVLEGSVQRSAEKIRINAQLIDVMSGGHIWAERYDGTIEDLFDLQDVVIGKIVAALSPELVKGSQESNRTGETASIEAYDAFLRGMQHYRKATPDHYAKAVEYLNEATALDADFGEAYAVLAAIYLNSYKRLFTRVLGLEAFQAWNKTKENLQLAMRAPSPVAYQVASELSLELRRYDEAIEQAEKAISNEPNDAGGHAALASALIISGMPARALASVKTARRLDPNNEYYYAFLQGLAEFNQDKFAAAVVSFERALELNPELWSSAAGWGCAPSAPLLSAYAHLGRKEASQELLSKGGFGCPIESIVERSWPFKEPRDIERLSAGLRIAGVRERN
jgi:tetratricopeptide (TPR) repeat protein